MEPWNAQMMMDKYIYNYLVTKGLHTTAEIFAIEANVINPTNVAIESPEGFLMEWWEGFYDIYNSHQAEQAQRSYAKDAWTTDNVGYHIPFDVPTYSPHSATPVHNVSPLTPAFQLTTPENEMLFDLRFVEMDRSSQGVPFVTNSSYPVEQIPSIPQQLEGKDEGEGDDINFERTVQMEPNRRPLKKIKLSVPEPSEAGCSIMGSYSGMQQTP